MELSDVIFGHRLRLAILLVVVAAAVGIASVLTLAEPREYSSTVTFVAPATSRGNPSAVEQAVANLRANLGADSVVAAAAEAGNLSEKQVRGHLSIARKGASDTVEVTFTSEHRGISQQVVSAAAQALVTEVTTIDLTRAAEQTARIQAEVDAIQADFDAFMADNELELPDEEFRNISSELTAMRVSLANARIDGSSRVAALQETVADLEGQLADLAPKVRRYEDFNLSLDRARRRLDSAIDAEAAVRGQLASVEPTALEPSRERQVDRATDVARAGAAAGGVAVVIVLLLFVIVEIRNASVARRAPAKAAEAVAARPVATQPSTSAAPAAPRPPAPPATEATTPARPAEGAPLGLR